MIYFITILKHSEPILTFAKQFFFCFVFIVACFHL